MRAGRDSQHSWAEGPRRPSDRTMRAVYWAGFRVLRWWWWLRRPHHSGAMVALWVDDRLLMLRLSYRHHLSLPGGGIGRGETAEQAALRELEEEVGLRLEPGDLRLAWRQQSLWDYRQDHVTIFETELAVSPDLQPDGREVVEARLISPLAVLAGPCAPHLRSYLLHRLGTAGTG